MWNIGDRTIYTRQKLAISIFVRLFIDRVDCLSTENRAAERFKYLRAVCGSENWATSSSTSNPLTNICILFFDLLSPESFVMKFIFFRSIILYEKNKKQIQDGICSLKIWNIEWNSDVCVQNCTKCHIQRVNNVNNRGILALLEMFRYMEMETSYKSALSLEFRYFSTLLFPCLNNFLGEPGICNISQWRMDDSTFKDVKFVKIYFYRSNPMLAEFCASINYDDAKLCTFLFTTLNARQRGIKL